MYYMAKDPVVLAGEKRDMPKIELLPVNEGTPVFREFYISNISCIGAEKGCLSAVFLK
jgi:DNA sulfur modification protein DndE